MFAILIWCIRTIRSSLAIEGNSLSEEQVTAILNNEWVLGSQKQIIEVQNALRLYDHIGKLDAFKEKDLLKGTLAIDGKFNWEARSLS